MDMYKVVIEDYYRKNVGRIVARTSTLTDARKQAYSEIGKIYGKMISIYKHKDNTPGPMELIGEVQKWHSGERYWYPDKNGRKYPLYKDGTLGRRLR
ncbi:MAG: hypothetical protein IIY21_06180 [Clostridiales bacterium]|nr:hypothetical protein [Clostridiales bacterium]